MIERMQKIMFPLKKKDYCMNSYLKLYLTVTTFLSSFLMENVLTF